jgi:hypothetical protein
LNGDARSRRTFALHPLPKKAAVNARAEATFVNCGFLDVDPMDGALLA